MNLNLVESVQPHWVLEPLDTYAVPSSEHFCPTKLLQRSAPGSQVALQVPECTAPFVNTVPVALQDVGVVPAQPVLEGLQR